MPFFFQGRHRPTCAAEFNYYTLQGPNITGRGRPEKTFCLQSGDKRNCMDLYVVDITGSGRPEKTYSLPAEGTREIAGTYRFLTSQEADGLRYL